MDHYSGSVVLGILFGIILTFIIYYLLVLFYIGVIADAFDKFLGFVATKFVSAFFLADSIFYFIEFIREIFFTPARDVDSLPWYSTRIIQFFSKDFDLDVAENIFETSIPYYVGIKHGFFAMQDSITYDVGFFASIICGILVALATTIIFIMWLLIRYCYPAIILALIIDIIIIIPKIVAKKDEYRETIDNLRKKKKNKKNNKAKLEQLQKEWEANNKKPNKNSVLDLEDKFNTDNNSKLKSIVNNVPKTSDSSETELNSDTKANNNIPTKSSTKIGIDSARSNSKNDTVINNTKKQDFKETVLPDFNNMTQEELIEWAKKH